MDNTIDHYLLDIRNNSPEWAQQLEKYARENHVPIMEPLGIDFLMQIIRINKPSRILEIGTAIGYSALRMLEASPTSHIVSVERDEPRFQEAVQNIKKMDKDQNIDVLFGDALDITNEIKEKGPYDLLFIDAAKGQYQRFFELYSTMLTSDAVIISDNVLFKGLVANPNSDKERLNKIANKITTYNKWLMEHPQYVTTIVPIGDGIAISIKR
ncbi:O-methyltransferase [Aquibacillus kalidii]|uniref:O-methyltransferase n=1 Tax=Aquibacillus kalidii TaxID=2762597 RepID=UPI001C99AB47|nr:O-methyltransferase [Aquibacillus kalidii]